MAQRVKRLPAMQETWVRSLGRKVPLEKEMATHSSILAWRIPRTEEPGGLQFTGSQSQTRLSSLTHSLTLHSHVFICSASLCLLVGAFNPFTFKVIIDMYDPITIVLVAMDLFCVDLFLLLCFLPKEVPLVFVVKPVWWC